MDEQCQIRAPPLGLWASLPSGTGGVIVGGCVDLDPVVHAVDSDEETGSDGYLHPSPSSTSLAASSPRRRRHRLLGGLLSRRPRGGGEGIDLADPIAEEEVGDRIWPPRPLNPLVRPPSCLWSSDPASPVTEPEPHPHWRHVLYINLAASARFASRRQRQPNQQLVIVATRGERSSEENLDISRGQNEKKKTYINIILQTWHFIKNSTK